MNTNRSPYLPPAGSSKGQPGSITGFLWVMCSWCGIDLDLHLVPARNDGEVSHGMCRPCFSKVMGYEFIPVVLFIPWSILAMAGGIQ